MKNRTVRQRFTGLSTAVLAACLGVGLLSAPGQAVERPPTASTATGHSRTGDAGPVRTGGGPAAEPGGPTAEAPTAPVDDATHVGRKSLKAADRPPLSASKDALRRDYDDPGAALPSHLAPSMKADAKAKAGSKARTAAECNVSDFTSRTGSDLVQQIKSSTTDCVNTLFRVKGNDGNLAFREAQMVTVANALRDGSAAYPGDSSTGMPQLVLYLRAGYYVQYYDPDTVGSYGPELRTAIQGGLDAFFASSHAFDVTDANGETLSEAVILIDSAVENARYLSVVKRLLANYDSSYNSSWYMLNAVNNVYTVTFRGHQVPEFVAAVEADPSLLDALHDFASRHLDLLGTDRSYLTSNAGLELGRFLQEASLRPKASPLAAGLLGQSSITGPTAPLWVGVAQMVEAYDKANCSYYGTCDLAQRLKSAVLPVSYTCSDSIRILAQQMSTADLDASCTSLRNQDAYFHDVVRDSGPVDGDRNTTIEVVVFDSSKDYQTYAGAIYGIDTNNGGMYLEGDPAAAGNQPRFIAYEAEWVRPEFQIWNLNHEYTHYLDGRFDMYGDFGAGMTTPTVWWVEGFAEYVSYSYRKVTYDDAAAQAANHTYTLRTLFDTTYDNADQTRIYNWGYLAVRYMLESHRADVDTLLGLYRKGDWDGARTLLTSTIGSRYDADWNTWLTACAAGSCGTGTNPPTEPGAECAGTDTRELGKDCKRSGLTAVKGDYAYLYVLIPAGTAQLKITASGGTGDADLYYSADSWATTDSYTSRAVGAGNEHTLTIDNPAPGYRYISLHGVEKFDGVTVSTQY
ncbi:MULTISPECIES: M9 family metallopeptidase [unclassified Streptomyces]|uniref:M9 family metallopeptidase n=1 Tax=unclassified Streptomyces TaxID=2593676 RepID=UPI0037FA03CD